MKNKENLIEVVSKELVKGIEVEYNQKFYVDSNEEFEYQDGYLLDENLNSLRDAYRIKVGLLTKKEIIEIRKKYLLSQEDLSIILGLGKKTIARYESNTIQDRAYDILLRKFSDDYSFAKECLDNSKDKFKKEKYDKINDRIKELSNKDNANSYIEISLKSIYLKYDETSSECGFTRLSINKIKNIIGLFASKINNLYSVKLNKLLWYSDSLNYLMNKSSMTGIVYLHEAFGAMPIKYDLLLELDSINIQVEEINDNISKKITPSLNFKFDKSLFSKSELDILNKVIDKFKNISGKDISNLMHKEDAYNNTKIGQTIDYKYISKLKAI